MNKGYRHLTAADVAEIRSLRHRRVSSKHVEAYFGVSRSTITRVMAGHTRCRAGTAARVAAVAAPPIYRATMRLGDSNISQIRGSASQAVSVVRGLAQGFGRTGDITVERSVEYGPTGAKFEPMTVVGPDGSVETDAYLDGFSAAMILQRLPA